MFNQFKLSPVAVSDSANLAMAALAVSHPGVWAMRFAADTIAERLRSKPETYLQYGPYWWAVKRALGDMGHSFGPSDDALIRAEYGGTFMGYSVFMAAEQFRDYYNATYLAGTASFNLSDEDNQAYGLFDPDMEVRRLGAANPLLVAADLTPVESEEPQGEGAAAVLDDAGSRELHPFTVDVVNGLDMWGVRLYAQDKDAAHAKVRAWEDSGAIAVAIDGGELLDSASVALHVDPAHRVILEMARV